MNDWEIHKQWVLNDESVRRKDEYDNVLEIIKEMHIRNNEKTVELTIVVVEDNEVVHSRVEIFTPADIRKFKDAVTIRVITETQYAELILEWT